MHPYVFDIATPRCPRETDDTVWQIEWNATDAGATAKQLCPGFSEPYMAYRDCNEGGSWNRLNVTECQSAGLSMLNERINDILSAAVVNIDDLSAVSSDLSSVTNTSGISAISPEDLSTTNSILSSLIRLVQ